MQVQEMIFYEKTQKSSKCQKFFQDFVVVPERIKEKRVDYNLKNYVIFILFNT